MPPRKKTPAPVDVQEITDRIATQVAQRGGCTIASCKIPKVAKAEVLAILQARGLEVTRSAIRRPLSEQLRDVLATGAYVPLGPAIKSHVAGATPAEAKKAALSLAAAGEAHIVARARAELLAPASALVVPRDSLASTIKALDATLKLLKRATKRGSIATVLREDVAALLEPVPRGVPAIASRPALRSVTEVAGTLLDPAVGLAFVPAVVRELARHCSIEVARASLLDAARGGLIELRPESGLGRLSEEDKGLCVRGIDGTPLSWLRLVESSRP